MRPVDADAIYNEALENHQKGEIEDWEADLIINYLDGAPTINTVEIVYCKDCEHAERYERADGGAGYYCGHPQNSFTYGERWDRVFKPVKEADDFCSYGGRMEGGNDNVSD